jgi:hypothetical protein
VRIGSNQGPGLLGVSMRSSETFDEIEERLREVLIVVKAWADAILLLWQGCGDGRGLIVSIIDRGVLSRYERRHSSAT